MISTGTASGSVPWKTVQAVAFMPGLTSFNGMISTLPALGRMRGASPGVAENTQAAKPRRIAANRIFMG